MTQEKAGKLSQPAPASSQKVPTAMLPVFLEFSFTIAKTLIVIVGIATVIVSILAGASVWTVAMRGAITVLSLGFLLWLINWLFAHNILEKELDDMEKSRAEDPTFSTVERRA